MDTSGCRFLDGSVYKVDALDVIALVKGRKVWRRHPDNICRLGYTSQCFVKQKAKGKKMMLVAARFELARTCAHWDSEEFLNPTP